MRQLILALVSIGIVACAEEPASQDGREREPTSATTQEAAEGFVLKKGEGEPLLDGIIVKASPKTGTMGSILVEQTFQRGGRTGLHIHDQGGELFYVVSGRGMATLGEEPVVIETGDVIFVPRGEVHRIGNPDDGEPLVVVFFMDSPELVEQFRAIHERVTLEPDRPITPEEEAEIAKRIGGERPAN